MHRTSRAFCLLLALVVAACSASETTMSTNDPASSGASAGTSAQKSRYRQNPRPRQAYLITMTLADAPGPFGSVEGFAQYDIVNRTCLPPMDKFSGAQTEAASASPPVTFTKVADNTYTATIYTDLMLEEDIYGNGVCHWQIVQVSVRLKATGAHEETRFAPSLSREALEVGTMETTYFRKVFYPRDADIEDYSAYGQTDRSKMSTTLSDSDLFTITLASKALTP